MAFCFFSYSQRNFKKLYNKNTLWTKRCRLQLQIFEKLSKSEILVQHILDSISRSIESPIGLPLYQKSVILKGVQMGLCKMARFKCYFFNWELRNADHYLRPLSESRPISIFNSHGGWQIQQELRSDSYFSVCRLGWGEERVVGTRKVVCVVWLVLIFHAQPEM